MPGKGDSALEGAFTAVDPERLYQHVLALEGPRSPLGSQAQLDRAKEYIMSKFQEFGFAVEQDSFEIPPFTAPFTNIDAHAVQAAEDRKLSPPKHYIFTAHYDTVPNCPGAVDNAGSVAMLLEIARVSAKFPGAQPPRFLIFAAEEFNASWAEHRDVFLRELGIKGRDNRYQSLRYAKFMRDYKNGVWKLRRQGLSPGDAIKEYWEVSRPVNDPKLTKFLDFEHEHYSNYSHSSIWGEYALVGSAHWVAQHQTDLPHIKCVINLDAVGFDSSSVSPFEPTALRDARSQITSHVVEGKFPAQRTFSLQFIAPTSCRPIADQMKQIIHDRLFDLELVPMYITEDFEGLAQTSLDLLRSDHASFWKHGLPAVFMTDLPDWPNPYYHTPADTIDKIDFGALAHITQMLTDWLGLL